ncbi:MAG: hypothetical protein JWN99_532 [Ilumatobacteraceae bacterium]|nr:hypothetical protein [Ilumatobacteraceae bacterium]
MLIVIAQNIIRGAKVPANDASPAEVLSYYGDHRSIVAFLVGTFVVSGTALAVFVGGAMRRMLASDRRGWALTGMAGALGVLILFSTVVGADQALSVVAHRDQPDLSAIEALWSLHNSLFTVLYLSIGIALLGLSRAGVAAGITPRAFERVAPVGSLFLLIAATAGPFLAAGQAMPLFAVGGVGFVIWLAFLATTGLRLVRSGATS